LSLKRLFLRFSKSLGLFELARTIQRRGVRILCYHGFAIDDEALFRPKLFILRSTFEKRLLFLASKHFPILSFAEALERLSAGTLPAGATVITIDDGFYSTLRCAVPLLRRFSFPATVYVTTYYSLRNNPIFRLAIQYMFWKTRDSHLDLNGLPVSHSGIVELADHNIRDRLMWEIIEHGEKQLGEAQRCELAQALSRKLHVDYEAIVRSRALTLMNRAELRDLVACGIDLELHTHRHRLPEEENAIRQELGDNRAILEPITGRPLQHLCYPSGIWSERSWPLLSAVGVKSATTCEPGLNLVNTPKLGLKRFLDGENISHIEFESEMCGFNDFLRAIARISMRRPSKKQEQIQSGPGLN
jgi:peptidoglycan/xylan/chitin deacetylase (PgdA/CDA1 family)